MTTTGTWSQHDLDSHPCDLYRPPVVSEHRYVVLYLHDATAETLRGRTEFEDQFDAHGLTVVAPRWGPCWWTDRVMPMFDGRISAVEYLLQSVLPFVRNHLQAGVPRIGLLGVGMGGQGALRLAYKFPLRFPVVAAISPAIDYHLLLKEGDEILLGLYGDPESARQDTATLHVHPLNWPRHQFFCCDRSDDRWFDSADRLRMKLASLGIPFECDLETDCAAERSRYQGLMASRAVGFLAERLEKERLRVE